MTGTNHGLTGAVIALVVKEPLLAVPLSFASHFACDAIPHFGMQEKNLFKRNFNIMLVADFLLAVCIMGILGAKFPDQKWTIWACMVAAASPDLAWAYYRLYLGKIKHRTYKYDPISQFHAWVQWYQKIPGAIIETAWFIFMGSILITFH